MGEYLGEMWRLAVDGKVQGIFFYASLYALLLLGYSTIFQFRVASWPKTKGILLRSAVKKTGGTTAVVANQRYLAHALYEYSVNGRAYKGNRVSPWVILATHNAGFVLKKQLSRIDRDEDGRVSVYYNPKNPVKSFLIKPGRIGILITFLLSVGPFMGYIAIYHLQNT